jgi:hypothetical protein
MPWHWNAATATLDPDSPTLIATWRSTQFAGTPLMTLNNFGVALATTAADSPGYNVPMTSGGSLDSTIYIPLGTLPDPGGDGHLSVRDPIHGREHDFWQAVYDSGTQKISSTSSGSSFPIDFWTENYPGITWGSNDANFPLARVLVTPEEISAGFIGHPLSFAQPAGTGGVFGADGGRYPATFNNPHAPTAGQIVEGTWIRLDPNYDVATSGLPDWQKTVAHALQDYGAFLRDGSAGEIDFHGENPINRGGSSVWWGVGHGIPTSGNYAFFSGSFPWDSMQVLQPPAQAEVPFMVERHMGFSGR